MNFWYFLIPLITLLIATTPSSFSDNSSLTEHGFFGVEQDTYTLTPEDVILVKISGIGNMPAGVDRERANITITHPDSTEDGHRVFSGSDGYFELLLPLSYDSQQGVYKVFASFHGHILGEVYFTVERISLNDADTTSDSSNEDAKHVFAFRTSMFEVETDSLSYEKDSIIQISGAVPTQPKLDLTLQIIDPMNNIILINQITPNPDGTFEDSVNTNSPLWKFEGDYNIRINHNEQDLYSTFSFIIPTNEIAVPNPIEPSPEPPKNQEPEVIEQEPVIQNPPPAITSPPPPQVTVQESDEFTPSGLIVLAIIFFIIAIIIKKKRGKKSPSQTQSQTYSSTSRQSDSQAVLMQFDSTTSNASTPTKIDDIKVAIEKIDSLIRRNRNKIGECNAELTYYNGPHGGDWVTKDAMLGYYELRIQDLEDFNENLTVIRGYCEQENTEISIKQLDDEISNHKEIIKINGEEIGRFEALLSYNEPTAPLVIEFYEKKSHEYRTEISLLKEIKQIIKNYEVMSTNSDDIKKERREELKKAHPDNGGSEEEFKMVMKKYEIPENQLLINEYKSYAKKLEDNFNKIQKLIDDETPNLSSYVVLAAKNTLKIYKQTVDNAIQYINSQSDEELAMLPKTQLQEEIQTYNDMMNDIEEITKNVLNELKEARTDLPKEVKEKYTENTYVDNVDSKISDYFDNTFKKLTETKNELVKYQKYYESIMPPEKYQEMLDDIDRLLSIIDSNIKTHKMHNEMPEEVSEPLMQQHYQDICVIYGDFEKKLYPLLNQLKEKRKEESDDSELQRRIKQVEDDYYAEKRAERENRDV